MLFSASIAFTFVLSLSGIAVHSAPIVHKRDLVQACTGPNGSGECVVLNVAAQDASLAAGCTNVSGISSLIMNVDDDCVSFPNPDCDVGDGVAQEIFSDNSGNLAPGIASFSCSQIPGLVNGLFPQ